MKFKKVSELTFEELTENLAYVKIIYNGKLIYNDENGKETLAHLLKIKSEYKDKIVYKISIKVVDFHHCILKIKGEK